MSPVTNARIIFNSPAEGYPEPGKTLLYDTSKTIDLDNVTLNGGLLVKVLDISMDPYLRGKLRDPSKNSDPEPFSSFTIGEPIENDAVAVVLRSENTKFKKGEHVFGTMPFANYAVVNDTSELRVLDNKYNLPWVVYVGAAGMPGKTAYMGWKEHSHAKKGDTVFVSAGAGPVGSFVIQLAKKEGLKVIASAGSDEKIQFMKGCGADIVFNYKTTSTEEVLEREGPIDVYWDNVGGETLDIALEHASIGARFIECGMISGYNIGGAAVKNLFYVVSKSISLNGFIVKRLHPKYEETFYEEVPKLIAEGKLNHGEHVWTGLEHAGEALLAVLQGRNKAKAVVHVANE